MKTYNAYRIAAQAAAGLTAAGLTLAAALLAAACVNSPAYEQAQQQTPTPLPTQPVQALQPASTPGSTPLPIPTPTRIPTPAPTPAASLEATVAAAPTPRKPEDTPTPTPTATATVYLTATPTATAVPPPHTATPLLPSPTATSTPLPTATVAPRPPTPTPTATQKPAPSLDYELGWIIRAYDNANVMLPVQGREWRIEGAISVTQAAPNAKTSTQIQPATVPVIAYLDNDVKSAVATTVTLAGVGVYKFSIVMLPVSADKGQPSTAVSSGIEKLLSVEVNPGPAVLAALTGYKSIAEQVNETDYGNNMQTVKVRFMQTALTPTPLRSGGGGGSGGSYGTSPPPSSPSSQPPPSQPRPPPPPSGGGPSL